MGKTLNQILRPFVPNFGLRIQHPERGMYLNVRLRQHLGLIARGANAYEKPYVDVLRELVLENDLVFDVGANIGFYSLLFSSLAGKGGKVVAYEPDPANLRLLEDAVSGNKRDNVVIRNIALGRKSGRDSFSIDKATGSTGHLGSGLTSAETIFGKGKEILVDVDVRTLDQEAELWGSPRLIKMDVEGGEFDVLCGGASLLERDRPFVVSELSAWNEDRLPGESNAALATKLLSDAEYSMWDLDTGSIIQGGEVPWMIFAVPKERLKEDCTVKALARLSSLACAI